MAKVKTVIVSWFLCLNLMVLAQSTNFTRTYGVLILTDFMEARSVKFEPSSNTYVFAGVHATLVTGSNTFLVRTDTLGNPIFMKYIGNGSEYANDFVKTTDGAYVLVGGTDLGSTDSGAIYVVKVDTNATTVQWSFYLNGTTNSKEDAQAVIQHSSGNLIIVGSDSIDGTRNWDGFVIAMDLNGNVLWQTAIGGSGNDYFYDVVEAPNGNIVVVGSTDSYGETGTDVYLVVLDPATGNIINTYTYGENGGFFNFTYDEGAFAITTVPSGGYVITGYFFDPIALLELQDVMVLRLDNSFNVVWANSFYLGSIEMGRGVDVSGNTVYVAAWGNFNLGQIVGLALGVDLSNGSLQWAWEYSGSIAHSYFYDVDVSPYGPIFSGNRGDLAYWAAYLVKTDNTGKVAGASGFCDMITPTVNEYNLDYVRNTGGTAVNPNFTKATLTASIGTEVGQDTICLVRECGRIDSVVTAFRGCGGDTAGYAYYFINGGNPPFTHYVAGQTFTGDTVGPLPAGTYVDTIVDQYGCIIIDTFTITEPTPLTASVSASQEPLCFGDSTGWIKVSASGGTPPYTHIWSNGMTGDSIFNLPAGTYTDTVKDANGCQTTVTITLNQPPQLVITLDSLVDPTSCITPDGWIKITVSGGTSPYSYSWSNGNTTDSATGLSYGPHVVVVTDVNNCTISDTFILSPPDTPVVVAISVIPPLCNGDSNGMIIIHVDSGTSPYTHTWNHGISFTGDTIDTLTGVYAGNFVDTITDANGCQTSVTVTVTEPDPLSISLSVQDVSACNGSDGIAKATVSGGTPPYNYYWSNGATGDSIGGLTAGTYSVVITDDNGCTDSAQFVINEPPRPVVSYKDSLLACSPPAFAIAVLTTGGLPPFLIIINDTISIDSLYLQLPPGSYNLILTDSRNCADTISFVIDSPSIPTANVFPDINTIKGGDTIVLEGQTNGVSWWWSPGQFLEDSTALSPAAFPHNTTTYYFYAISSDGCIALDSAVIYVEIEPTVFIPTMFSPNGDGINDVLYVRGFLNSMVFRIFDRWGNKVFETTEQALGWDGTFNGKPLNTGLYAYYFEGQLINGEKVTRTGYILLVK